MRGVPFLHPELRAPRACHCAQPEEARMSVALFARDQAEARGAGPAGEHAEVCRKFPECANGRPWRRRPPFPALSASARRSRGGPSADELDCVQDRVFRGETKTGVTAAR